LALGLFFSLKTPSWGPECSKQAEMRPAGFPTILGAGRSCWSATINPAVFGNRSEGRARLRRAKARDSYRSRLTKSGKARRNARAVRDVASSPVAGSLVLEVGSDTSVVSAMTARLKIAILVCLARAKSIAA